MRLICIHSDVAPSVLQLFRIALLPDESRRDEAQGFASSQLGLRPGPWFRQGDTAEMLDWIVDLMQLSPYKGTGCENPNSIAL